MPVEVGRGEVLDSGMTLRAGADRLNLSVNTANSELKPADAKDSRLPGQVDLAKKLLISRSR